MRRMRPARVKCAPQGSSADADITGGSANDSSRTGRGTPGDAVRIILMFEVPLPLNEFGSPHRSLSQRVCARAGTGTRPRESAAAWFPREAGFGPTPGPAPSVSDG